MVDTDSLRVEVLEGEESVVVALVGDLDSAVAGKARTFLEDAIETAGSRAGDQVIVDASRITFCDSTGLSILVRAREDAERRGIRLSVRSLTEPLRELLRLTGLDALLEHEG